MPENEPVAADRVDHVIEHARHALPAEWSRFYDDTWAIRQIDSRPAGGEEYDSSSVGQTILLIVPFGITEPSNGRVVFPVHRDNDGRRLVAVPRDLALSFTRSGYRIAPETGPDSRPAAASPLTARASLEREEAAREYLARRLRGAAGWFDLYATARLDPKAAAERDRLRAEADRLADKMIAAASGASVPMVVNGSMPVGFAASGAPRVAKPRPRKSAPKGRRQHPQWELIEPKIIEWLENEGTPTPGDGKQAELEKHVAALLLGYKTDAATSTVRRHIKAVIEKFH